MSRRPAEANGLGAAERLDFERARHLAGSHFSEWTLEERIRYDAASGGEGERRLWNPAAPVECISSPWIAGRAAAGLTLMRSALPERGLFRVAGVTRYGAPRQG